MTSPRFRYLAPTALKVVSWKVVVGNMHLIGGMFGQVREKAAGGGMRGQGGGDEGG